MMLAENCKLFIDRQILDPHGERHNRGFAGSGHGAQAAITVVDKHTQTRGHEDFACGKQRQSLGSALLRSLYVLGYRFIVTGRDSSAPNAPSARA